MTNTTTGTARTATGAATLAGPRQIGTVYVTGGSSGLGAAVVAAVAAAGGTPAVIDRVPPDQDVPHVLADLSDSAAAAAAVSALVKPSAHRRRRHRGRHRRLRTTARHRTRNLGKGGSGQPVRDRRGDPGRAPLPGEEQGHGGHRRVHPRPEGRQRRHRLLRIEIRGARLHPCVGGGDGRPGRRHAADSRRNADRLLRWPAPTSTSRAPDADLDDPANTANAVLTALRQPVGSEIREMLVMASGREFLAVTRIDSRRHRSHPDAGPGLRDARCSCCARSGSVTR